MPAPGGTTPDDASTTRRALDDPHKPSVGPISLLRCPRCHFSIHPRAAWLAVDYCPRCLGRRGVAELLRTVEP